MEDIFRFQEATTGLIVSGEKDEPVIQIDILELLLNHHEEKAFVYEKILVDFRDDNDGLIEPGCRDMPG